MNTEDNNPWKELNKNLFTDDILQIHCDTRDFYCTFNVTNKKEIKDLPTLIKYKKAFFFTIDEVYSLLERLYVESGGKASWRMLSFEQDGKWFKYLRIYKTDYGYVIGTSFNDNHKFYRRSFFENARIDDDSLNRH